MKNDLIKKNVFTLENTDRRSIGFRYISLKNNYATIKNGRMIVFNKNSNCRSIKNENSLLFPISEKVNEAFIPTIFYKGITKSKEGIYYEN